MRSLKQLLLHPHHLKIKRLFESFSKLQKRIIKQLLKILENDKISSILIETKSRNYSTKRMNFLKELFEKIKFKRLEFLI